MLLPQPASAFNPVSFSEAAEAKDKHFDGQEEAYNRDKKDLCMLAPDEKVRVQCKKTSFWDKTGTVIEVRPDKLSYLLDVEGNLLIRARFMIRPLEEGGVSEIDQIQDQGGAQSDFTPRRSERFKDKNSVQKCSLPMMKLPSCGNIAALTGSIGNKWRRRCNLSPKPTTYHKMPGDFPWSMFTGKVLPQGPPQSSWSPSLHWPSSYVAGSGQRANIAPNTAILNSCPPLHRQLCPGPPSSHSRWPERPETQKVFEAAKWFRTPSGWASVPGAYLPSPGVMPPQLPFPQFPPIVQDYGMGQHGYRVIPFPRSTSGNVKRSRTPVGRQSPITPGLSSSQMSRSQLCSVREQLYAPRLQSPPRFRSRPLLQGPLRAPVSPSPVRFSD